MKRILYLIYLWLIALPTLLPITIITCLLTILGAAVLHSKWMGHKIPSFWARCICWFTLVRVEVKGKENIDPKTSYVFVANHQGAYDIFAVYGWLPHSFKWMMKKSLRRIFLIGYTCAKDGHIFVDRSSATAVRHTIKTAEETLKDGMSLVVFPEGARTFDGRMTTFKRGAYMLALEFNLPLVPLTIDGAFDILPRTAKLPRPGKITLTIHRPVEVPEGEDARTEVMEMTRQAIESALPDRYKSRFHNIC